ncbi:uncharacterized protein PV09_03125 [Verruconis gallopava]|uniref:U-box domain-containing protein n=1 Tax=Verruconis gallopava TaxID=253628 RepID=A0A0D1YZ14_9PEZI|nr:uncharacterized protein PV09_03125 [Verruconis gallopava]KIW05932.1 hypothetical protein PV09_03125 [Verruconis gallopava]
MPTPEQVSEKLKAQGNACFKEENYSEAEHYYTLAIQQNPSNPILWTNRANARLKLGHWQDVIDDCLRSIELSKENLKGYYFLAQAQYELQHPNEALISAMTAYDICARAKTQTSNAFSIAQFVLKCKKAKWDLREKERLRRRNGLLKELELKLEADQQAELDDIERRRQAGEIGEVGAAEEISEVKEMYQTKIHDLRTAFANSDPNNMEKREIPEYLIDPISFEIMHDPVITKTGQSYERATIVEHLKRNPTDPLSREPLRVDELRTNVNLKKACDEFWEGSRGWAYEW